MVDVQNVRNVFEEAHTSNGTKQLKVYFIYVEMKSKLGERERDRGRKGARKRKKKYFKFVSRSCLKLLTLWQQRTAANSSTYANLNMKNIIHWNCVAIVCA